MQCRQWIFSRVHCTTQELHIFCIICFPVQKSTHCIEQASWQAGWHGQPPLSLPSSPRLMIVRQSAPPRALCMPPPPAFLGLPLNKRQVWQLLTHIKCKLWRNRALHVPILRSCCSNLCLDPAPHPNGTPPLIQKSHNCKVLYSALVWIQLEGSN